MATENSDGWMLTFAYICFGLGAVLLVIGFILVFYLIYKLRKKKAYKERLFASSATYPKLYTSSTTWLKSSAHPRNGIEVGVDESDSLHLDVDAIYAQPTDVHRVYNQVAGEHELSQTESQMGSDRSRGSPRSSNIGSSMHIYSTPNKSSKLYIDSEIIPEDDDSPVAPSLPDRSHMRRSPGFGGDREAYVARAKGGVVSPGLVELENARADAPPLDPQTPRSARTIASMDREAALAALEEAYAGEEGASATTTPRQLSSKDLVDSVYHVGIPVSPIDGPSDSHGSLKSTVYRYSYYTEPTEPLPGEGEIEYDIMKM